MNKTKAYCKGIVSFVLTGVFLASCGGGGGGGVSSAPGLHITLPPSVIPPHTVVSAIERSSSPQLDRVRGLSVLDGSLSGAGVQVGVVDSGVMASHDEFDGRVHGGGDWQGGGDGTSDPHGHGTHVASLLIASGDGNGMVGIAPQAWSFRSDCETSSEKSARQTGSEKPYPCCLPCHRIRYRSRPTLTR